MKQDSASVEDAAVVAKTVSVLREWEQGVDAVQSARLSAARRRALATPDAVGLFGARRFAPALATALMLAVGVGFWPHPTTAPNVLPMTALAEAPELATADEALDADPLLDADLDLYLWLNDADDISGAAS